MKLATKVIIMCESIKLNRFSKIGNSKIDFGSADKPNSHILKGGAGYSVYSEKSNRTFFVDGKVFDFIPKCLIDYNSDLQIARAVLNGEISKEEVVNQFDHSIEKIKKVIDSMGLPSNSDDYGFNLLNNIKRDKLEYGKRAILKEIDDLEKIFNAASKPKFIPKK